MVLKTLQIAEDLQEHITYNDQLLPLSVCIDNFDDYFQREWQCHWHDEFEFGIVQRGCAEFTVYDGQNQTVKTLHRGDGIFIASGSLHSAKGIEPNTIIAEFVLPINFFDISIFETMFQQNVRPMIEAEIASLALHANIPDDQPLLSGIQELCSISEQETAYELHLIEAVCKVWRLLMIRAEHVGYQKQSNGNKIQEQRVKKILSFIHSNFGLHISIDDMAKAATISRTECFRCFQTILGKTPAEYLTEYRLSMATTMLANSDRTLSEISELCGFNSPSYFGKVFRERCGASPKKYREQVHQKD